MMGIDVRMKAAHAGAHHPRVDRGARAPRFRYYRGLMARRVGPGRRTSRIGHVAQVYSWTFAERISAESISASISAYMRKAFMSLMKQRARLREQIGHSKKDGLGLVP
eukprot:6115168-Pyramimonas_sp.AAC.1